MVRDDQERRRFNEGERATLYLAADGRCSRCGAELGPDWHADHVQPYSRAGATDVLNGQALCPKCNLEKGNKVVEPLRAWQERAMQQFRQWRARPVGDGYLVEATPGAGKTRFAIEVARDLFQIGAIDRVVVVVPTARLEKQWADDFAEFGIPIDPTWHAGLGTLASNFKGCAVTYAEVGFNATSFRRLSGTARTLVVLDEVHHCGDERTWGTAIRTAFEAAAHRLLLSGTPFRSDNNAIPFVRYVDGVGAPDFRYGYDDGLSDQIVRSVTFPKVGGVIEWDDRFGERRTSDFDTDADDREASERLRMALNPSGDLVRGMLEQADSQLQQAREEDPRAAGIVFCIDEVHARAVHSLLHALDREAVIATSADTDSDDRIAAFKTASVPWIVTIKKVSEGVNLPRLRVGVYLTTVTTEMFFRQAVGRIVRRRGDDDEATAWFFIPDDSRLREFALRIREQRDAFLAEEEEREQREQQPRDLFDLPGTATFVAATPTDAGAIAENTMLSATVYADAKRLDAELGLRLDVGKLAVALLQDRLKRGDVPADMTVPLATEEPMYRRVKRLRQQNDIVAKRIAAQWNIEHATVNAALNTATGISTVKTATDAQLERRLEIGRKYLKDGRV